MNNQNQWQVILTQASLGRGVFNPKNQQHENHLDYKETAIRKKKKKLKIGLIKG